MIEKLKDLKLSTMTLEAMVELYSHAKLVEGGYKMTGVEAPEYLEPGIATLEREINVRNREALMARRQAAMSRIDALKTPTEKRRELQDEIDALDKKLGFK